MTSQKNPQTVFFWQLECSSKLYGKSKEKHGLLNKQFCFIVFPSTPRKLVRQPDRRISTRSPKRKQEGLASKKQKVSSRKCSGHLEHRFNTSAFYFFCSESKFNENLKTFSSKPHFLQHVPSETKSALLTILPIPFGKSQEGFS